MHLITKYFGLALIFVLTWGASLQAYASYLGSRTDTGIVYSFFSAPNKILRYDMARETTLETTPLGKEPTAFTVANGIAYVAFGRELRAMNLAAGTHQFIRNTTADISEMVVLGENLFAVDQAGTLSVISTVDFHQIDNTDSTSYPGTAYIASSVQSAIYFRSAYTSSTYKIGLGGDGKVKSQVSSNVYSNSPTSKLFINYSQNKIYDTAGSIYFADTLATAGSLNESIDSLAFVGDNPITVKNNILKVFGAEGIAKAEITLASKPVFTASHGQKIFTFSLAGNDLAAFVSDLSGLALPSPGQAVNPQGLIYTPDFYNADDEGNIYLVDRESLSVFRWSTSQNTYLETWPLSAPPTSATYSSAHKRLYLGYSSGEITYISPAEAAPREHSFATSTATIFRLIAAGQFLLAVDRNEYWHGEYILDANGKVISTNTQNALGEYYLWSATNNRIYRSSNFYTMSSTEVNPTTGTFGAPSTANYSNTVNTELLAANESSQYLLNGAGQLLDPLSFNLSNSLSNSVLSAAWVDGNLITIGKAPLSVQLWGANYEQLFSYPLRNATAARLLKTNGKLVLVQQQNTGPNFSVFNPNQLPDTDGDGTHDFKDNCSNIANTDQIDSDNDGQGNSCDTDDDNDGISDSSELALNLNPLNTNDAQEDLDKDGFSNIVEIIAGTVLTDANSTPKAISNYFESFENGWPTGFYSTAGRRPWSTQTQAATGSHSLLSSPFLNNESASELNFIAFFNAGQFSFKYKMQGNSGNNGQYVVSVFIDDMRVAEQSFYSSDNSWQLMTATVNRGVHKISIRLVNNYSTSETVDKLAIDDINFQSNPNSDDTDGDGIGGSFDNCPSNVNENQADLDSDGMGDACDTTDDRPKDSDFDLVDDRFDNCPFIKNSQADDMDGDNIGDACDSDIDGDGVANDVEKTFSFMNEKDPTDAAKDQDGDGVNNGSEIASSTRPDVANAFPTLSLLDYFPVGAINSKYISHSSGRDYYYTEIMKKLPTQNTYQITASVSWDGIGVSEFTSRIERKDSGIYLTQANESDYSNFMIMPAAMKLGAVITNLSSLTPRAASNGGAATITTTFELVKTGQTIWKGATYPSITIKKVVKVKQNTPYQDTYEWSDELTYVKGIGAIAGKYFNYTEINIISLDPPAVETVPVEEGKSGKKSGGGATDIWFLIIAVLFFIISNRRNILLAQPKIWR